EATSFGLWWGRHRERISRMIESLEIILRLWTEDRKVTYNGRYYKVVEAPFWPKPFQKPFQYGSVDPPMKYWKLPLNMVQGSCRYLTYRLKILRRWHQKLLRKLGAEAGK
ncbi:MAG: LLM class flavin-dependent oxidoreductase, partial [Candidatus Bathyarchaeia archaeon]